MMYRMRISRSLATWVNEHGALIQHGVDQDGHARSSWDGPTRGPSRWHRPVIAIGTRLPDAHVTWRCARSIETRMGILPDRSTSEPEPPRADMGSVGG